MLFLVPRAARADAPEPETARAPSVAASPPPSELKARVEQWKKKLVSENRVTPQSADGSVLSGEMEAGVFVVSVVGPAAALPSGVSLVLTKEGELETESGSILGTADLNGDGRPDLVLLQGGPFSVFADTATGPKLLAVSDRGGAYGWRTVRLAERDGKPALIATTETHEPEEQGCGPRNPTAGKITGITEEVTLQWNGAALAPVARKPMETAAQVAVLQRAWEAGVRKREANERKQEAEWRQREAVRQRAAAAERKRAAANRAAAPGRNH